MLYERPDGKSWRYASYRLPDSIGSRRPNNQPANKLRGGELHPEWREHPGDSCRPDRVFGHGHGDRNGRLRPTRSKVPASSDGYGPVRDLSIRAVCSAVKSTSRKLNKGAMGCDP